jgi:hypothetical protein
MVSTAAIRTHRMNVISSPRVVSADDRIEAVVNGVKDLIRSSDGEV